MWTHCKTSRKTSSTISPVRKFKTKVEWPPLIFFKYINIFRLTFINMDSYILHINVYINIKIQGQYKPLILID